MSDKVVIFDHSKELYWGPGGNGYVRAEQAGVYTRAEAELIARGCQGDRQLDLDPVPADHITTLKARIAELEAALKTESSRIDRLVELIADNPGGLLLHAQVGSIEWRGSGLGMVTRDLRTAIDATMEPKP